MSDEIKVQSKNTKTKLIIAIATVVIVVLTIVAVVLVSSSGATAKKVKEQLSLGNKYLSELNYEQAIAAYELAIEIDPKSADAYLGLAEVYEEMGEFDKAIAVLEEAIAEVEDEDYIRKIKDKLKVIEEKKQEAMKRGATATPVPTPTEAPTETPKPTETPESTATPEPTALPEPTVTSLLLPTSIPTSTEKELKIKVSVAENEQYGSVCLELPEYLEEDYFDITCYLLCESGEGFTLFAQIWDLNTDGEHYHGRIDLLEGDDYSYIYVNRTEDKIMMTFAKTKGFFDIEDFTVVGVLPFSVGGKMAVWDGKCEVKAEIEPEARIPYWDENIGTYGVYVSEQCENEEFRYDIYNTGEVVITVFFKKQERIVIPETIDGLPVIGVGNYPYPTVDYGEQIIEIEFPDSLTWIGAWAFWGEENISELKFSNSLVWIDEDAFYGDGWGIKKIIAPSGSYAEQYAIEREIPVETY